MVITRTDCSSFTLSCLRCLGVFGFRYARALVVSLSSQKLESARRGLSGRSARGLHRIPVPAKCRVCHSGPPEPKSRHSVRHGCLALLSVSAMPLEVSLAWLGRPSHCQAPAGRHCTLLACLDFARHVSHFQVQAGGQYGYDLKDCFSSAS